MGRSTGLCRRPAGCQPAEQPGRFLRDAGGAGRRQRRARGQVRPRGRRFSGSFGRRAFGRNGQRRASAAALLGSGEKRLLRPRSARRWSRGTVGRHRDGDRGRDRVGLPERCGHAGDTGDELLPVQRVSLMGDSGQFGFEFTDGANSVSASKRPAAGRDTAAAERPARALDTFAADPEWLARKAESEANGPLVDCSRRRYGSFVRISDRGLRHRIDIS